MLLLRESKKILQFYKLPVTQSRLEILAVFLKMPAALDQAAIAKHCVYKPDRATIYRNLQVLVARGVLHTVPSVDGNIYYALLPPEAATKHAAHLHFHCGRCGEITCLQEVPVPAVAVPAGFTAESGALLVEGICARCGDAG